MLQKRPADEEVKDYYHSKLSDYNVEIFKGRQLRETKPNFLGDYKHVRFFDKTVANKIDDNTYYKCWYSYSDAHDPADSSEYYYFVYVEEVPEHIVKLIEGQKEIQKYVNEK